MNSKLHIYLDYAASTPVDARVIRAMMPYYATRFGNPGSLHSFGQQAIAAVDGSRETIAKAIHADFREVIFTASATEANNFALRGAIAHAKRHAPSVKRPQIIVSGIEHESVLEVARELARDGVEVVYLPVDAHGAVDLKKVKENLTQNTVLVSVMFANNEIGTIQPIREIAGTIRDFRGQGTMPSFHVDAAQALQFLDCNVDELGVDMMTLSAHKIYGPKGVGCLYIRSSGRSARRQDGIGRTQPVIFGGGQEFGLRSGTENVPAIVGFAEAVAIVTSKDRERWNRRISALRGELWRGIKKICPKAQINGRGAASVALAGTLPNILNVYFPGHDAQDLLTRLDLAGLAVSSGSACRSRAMESSYVIEALGYDKGRARSSIRFSLGRPTSKHEISAALKSMKGVLK